MVDINFLKEYPELAANMRFEIKGSELLHLFNSIGNIPKSEEKPIEKKILSEADACKMFGLTRQTFHAMRKAGKISFHILSNRIYYIESELVSEMTKVNKRAC